MCFWFVVHFFSGGAHLFVETITGKGTEEAQGLVKRIRENGQRREKEGSFYVFIQRIVGFKEFLKLTFQYLSPEKKEDVFGIYIRKL